MQPRDEAVVGRALHARMLAGDRTASHDICGRYMPLVIAHLKGFCARKNLHLVEDDTRWDAAVEAVVAGYLGEPERYQPSRGKSLLGYLKMAAEGDLKNLISRKQHKVVPLFGDDWNNEPEDPHDVIADADERHSENELYDIVADAAETDEERNVLALLLAGERSNAVFAERLGWPDPTSAAATKRMNQMKDRLCKRLKRRFAGRMRDATAD